jgi:hypothetical protein
MDNGDRHMQLVIKSIKQVASRKGRNRPRIYISVDGETPLENLIERHARPVNLFRRFAKTAVERITEGTDTSYLRLNWSQHAGCRCPCSPGFIVTGSHPRLSGRDLYVTIGSQEPLTA